MLLRASFHFESVSELLKVMDSELIFGFLEMGSRLQQALTEKQDFNWVAEGPCFIGVTSGYLSRLNHKVTP